MTLTKVIVLHIIATEAQNNAPNERRTTWQRKENILQNSSAMLKE